MDFKAKYYSGGSRFGSYVCLAVTNLVRFRSRGRCGTSSFHSANASDADSGLS